MQNFPLGQFHAIKLKYKMYQTVNNRTNLKFFPKQFLFEETTHEVSNQMHTVNIPNVRIHMCAAMSKDSVSFNFDCYIEATNVIVGNGYQQ